MSYASIIPLYKPEAQYILTLLGKCYATEKVNGTSASIDYDASQGGDASIKFHPGGADYQTFLALFDRARLLAAFRAMGHRRVRVYGEAYGGTQVQNVSNYGPNLNFIVFEVRVGETWLNVPNADNVAGKLGLEFVPYELVDCTLEALTRERDRPSVVAERRGQGVKKREGIVIRPLHELRRSNEERVIAKFVGDDYAERLNRSSGAIIKAMVADVYREAAGEIVESKEAAAAIGRQTAVLFQRYLES